MSTGRNARVPLITPSRLMLISHSWSSIGVPATDALMPTPALLNTAPIGAGAHSATSAARPSRPWRSRTSSVRMSDGPLSSDSVCASASAPTSTAATGHP